MSSRRRATAQLPAGRSIGQCRLITLKEAHIEILRRLGATVGPHTRVPRAVLNSPRARMARLDRTLNGTRHQVLRARPTHDRLSRHTRAMSEAVLLSHRRSRRELQAPAQAKVRLVLCLRPRTHNIRPICRRMGRNHRRIRVTRHHPGQHSRPRQTHMIQTL